MSTTLRAVGFSFANGDRESAERAVREALGDTGAEDVLLAPVPILCDSIKAAFGMTVDALYALPLKAPDKSSLSGLGFKEAKGSSSYVYEWREPRYYSVQINNPQWGSWDEGGDVRLFTPLSDEYRIVVTFYASERKLLVKADDNDEGGASFEWFIESREHIHGWCSNDEMTVEEYFISAYNDPGIENIYLYSVELMERCIGDAFGMTIEELYALSPR